MTSLINSLPQINGLTLFGLILIIGVLGGHMAQFTRFFPKITGYFLIGLIIGPNILGIISKGSLTDAKVFIDIAVGLVLFQLGLQVDARKLYHNRKVWWMGIAESMMTFCIVFLALYLLHVDALTAALAASIGVSTSPVLTLFIASKSDVIGRLTQRSLSLTAINNIIAFCLFMLLLPLLHSTAHPAKFEVYMLLDPIYHLFGSIALGVALGYFMIKLGRLIGHREDSQFALLVGILVLSIGIASMFGVSTILTPLVLGIFTINMDHDDHLMKIKLGHYGEIFFIVLFVLTGAKLHLSQIASVGGIAIVFVVTRMISKCLPIYIISRRYGYDNTQSYALGLTLLPMADMAIGLLNTATEISTEFATSLSAIVLASVAIIELTSPLISIFAFRKAGEIDESVMVGH
jgi:Kef-type K+ transport system membrane component KefB